MPPPLKILFLEDIPTEHELAQRELRAAGLQYSAVCVDAREPFLQALQEFQPDLIISDYSMPDFTGMQALILAQNWNSELPFIILTGAMNEETAVNCMKAGATNYVLKDHLQRLPLAVQDALKQRQVRTDKAQAQAQLRESEAKFKDVFEAANVGKSLTSLSGEINVNQAFCDLLGYTRDELQHKNWQELTPPEDIEGTNKEMALLLSGAKKSTPSGRMSALPCVTMRRATRYISSPPWSISPIESRLKRRC
jgi:CheY-like chemotaxis protein